MVEYACSVCIDLVLKSLPHLFCKRGLAHKTVCVHVLLVVGFQIVSLEEWTLGIMIYLYLILRYHAQKQVYTHCVLGTLVLRSPST